MTATTTLVLGTKKGLIALDRGASGWRARPIEHAGIHVSYAFRDPRTDTLWAALDHGHWGSKLSRSQDGGRTWREAPAPKYPEGATGPCTGKPATLRYVYGMAHGLPSQKGRLYVGTVPGGLFQSDDDGASWTLADAFWNHPTRKQWGQGGKDFDEPGLHSILVDPRDPRRLVVGSSSAGVLETTDAGASWTPRNKGMLMSYGPDPHPEVGHDPHLLSACAAEPDVVWQQNHCGVFRSTDSGRTWTDVGQKGGPVFFGFPVAADAKDPRRAWLVPATSDEKRYAVGGAMCVARSDDGGKSWGVFRDGLPQQDCYDVVYRHGLDVRGDTVVVGSTTGNLWVSDDRGERWRSLGSSFPPILSVRFA